MPRISILGNCHVRSLAACISVLVPKSSVDFRTLGEFDKSTQKENKYYFDNLASADVILIQHPFPLNVLPEEFDVFDHRVHRFPMVTYTAFHPDSTYLIRRGKFIQGATGPYHSALVLAGFLEDVQPDRLIKLFNRFTFSSLGYVNQHQVATDILRRDFHEIGYDYEPVSSSGIFMHTMDHPKIVAMNEVAKQALTKSGIVAQKNAKIPIDPLDRDWKWPVYADLPFGQNYIFHVGIGMDSSHQVPIERRELLLSDFIRISYDIYKDVKFENEFPGIVMRAMNFIRNNLK